VRRGYTHLAEKNVGEFLVIVLAGVDQNGLDLRVAAHFAHQRANLWEIGARAHDIEDFEVLGHGAPVPSLTRIIASGLLSAGKRLSPFALKKH
jgi:hypothetical protein